MADLVPKNELQKFGRKIEVGESLLSDLLNITGSDGNIEWFMLYEKHPLAVTLKPRLLYIKVNILTERGLEMAEKNQSDIVRKCNLDSCDTANFARALAIAMALWNSKKE